MTLKLGDYRLGLDLGTNSLGWAMLRLDAQGHPIGIIRTGVRIFSDSRDPKTREPTSVQRRLARQARRRRDRNLRRMRGLLIALQELGFLPRDDDRRKDLAHLDPYELRKRALDGPLAPEHFGRALLHLAKRRGFKSNRKTQRRKDEESGAISAGTATLRKLMQDAGARTAGEYFANLHAAGAPTRARPMSGDPHGKPGAKLSYPFYVDRVMVEEEFEALWAAQARFRPDAFTESAKSRLKHIILYQRPLKPVMPGRCTLDPSEYRAPKALPSTARFVMFQELNHLRIQHGIEGRPLSLDERKKIQRVLERVEFKKFPEIKKLLGLPRNARFTHEEGTRRGLSGIPASAALANERAFGDRWWSMPEDAQDAVVARLIGYALDWRAKGLSGPACAEESSEALIES